MTLTVATGTGKGCTRTSLLLEDDRSKLIRYRSLQTQTNPNDRIISWHKNSMGINTQCTLFPEDQYSLLVYRGEIQNLEGSVVAECTKGFIKCSPVVFPSKNTSPQRSFQKDQPQQTISNLLVNLMCNPGVQLEYFFTDRKGVILRFVQVSYYNALKQHESTAQKSWKNMVICAMAEIDSILIKRSALSYIRVLTAIILLNFSTVIVSGGVMGSLALASMSTVRFLIDSSIHPRRWDISTAIT